MRAFLIAACSLAGGILVGLLISMVASPSINKLTAERNQLSAKLDSVECELSAARSELDAKQRLSETARRQISALEQQLAAREKVVPPPVASVKNVPVVEQEQPPAKPMPTAAEKRFAAALIAFLDYYNGTARLLDENWWIATAYGQSFSFAIIADPHVDGTADHLSKFQSAVNYIISTKATRNTQLVFVVGDIAWGGSNLSVAKGVLDRLNKAGIPYVPLIGDNEVQSRHERQFDATFAPQYRYLSGVFANWRKAPTPVNGQYLQNFSFDRGGVHFVCADFASRKSGDEGGNLNDFKGGTWPWVKDDIVSHANKNPKNENINIMTHIPMFHTGFAADQYLFDSAEYSSIKDFLHPYRSNVDSNYAGHIHQNFVWYVTWNLQPIYTSRVTDETWHDTRFPESNDRKNTVLFVTATNGASSITYSQDIVVIP